MRLSHLSQFNTHIHSHTHSYYTTHAVQSDMHGHCLMGCRSKSHSSWRHTVTCGSNMCESTRASIAVISLHPAKTCVSLWQWKTRLCTWNNLRAPKRSMRDHVTVQNCSIEFAANHMSQHIREMSGDGFCGWVCVCMWSCCLRGVPPPPAHQSSILKWDDSDWRWRCETCCASRITCLSRSVQPLPSSHSWSAEEKTFCLPLLTRFYTEVIGQPRLLCFEN